MSTTIYHHATVFTSERDHRTAEAFAVTDGVFSAVGTPAEVRAAVGAQQGSSQKAEDAGIAEVDLGGAFVAPGIIDSHTHLTTFGESIGKVQLRDCNDLDDLRGRLVAAHRADPGAPRVLGAGWLFDTVGEEHPTAAMLDEVLPDVPVYLDANDLHSVWVNSAALAELGIDAHSPDPVGGEIARDADGEATGMLYETAGRQYAGDFLEKASTPDDHVRHLENAFRAYVESGVTGATDMALNEADVAAIRSLIARDGRLPFPITGHVILEPGSSPEQDLAGIENIVALRESVGESDDAPWFRIAGVKFIMDGVIDARTATMREPYANGANCKPIWSAERIRPVAAAADAAGLQIAMHAIGDRTSEMALEVLEHCAAEGTQSPRRHRIEHLESVTDTTVERMAAIGATASMQPVHCDPAIMDNWMAVLGDERQEQGFPWQKFREAGVPMTLGSDAPTAPHEPLPNLYIALTGGSSLDPSLPPYHPERAFAPDEALTALTAGGAYAGEMEETSGRIRPGLHANFIVLDVDPLEADPAELLENPVHSTFVLGEELYRAR
ncbi:amidohydrolase [Nocardiopsis salina]|uniref:amidohydrolase n=1 Tax=Nocardiopsis salina TaxID=245836 RepID=UPI000594B871|nr:amidohydrolase [Nocardiopsis salina]